jgi:hypothetical protein
MTFDGISGKLLCLSSCWPLASSSSGAGSTSQEACELQDTLTFDRFVNWYDYTLDLYLGLYR